MPNPQQGSHSSHYCPLVFPPFLEKGKQCLWPTCSWTSCCSLPLPGSDHLLVFSFLATPGPADPATNSLSLSLDVAVNQKVPSSTNWCMTAACRRWEIGISWLPGTPLNSLTQEHEASELFFPQQFHQRSLSSGKLPCIFLPVQLELEASFLWSSPSYLLAHSTLIVCLSILPPEQKQKELTLGLPFLSTRPWENANTLQLQVEQMIKYWITSSV